MYFKKEAHDISTVMSGSLLQGNNKAIAKKFPVIMSTTTTSEQPKLTQTSRKQKYSHCQNRRTWFR